jgi:hypothetical protein
VFRVSSILQVVEEMERETGFEPATSSLGNWHSLDGSCNLLRFPRSFCALEEHATNPLSKSAHDQRSTRHISA